MRPAAVVIALLAACSGKEAPAPPRAKPADAAPVAAAPAPGGGKSLPGEQVSQRVHSVYLAGIRRCYKRALAADPTVTGRLALRFTVAETGGVVDPRVQGGPPEMSHCLEELMATWRFPAPKDVDGEPTEVEHEMTLDLRTE